MSNLIITNLLFYITGVILSCVSLYTLVTCDITKEEGKLTLEKIYKPNVIQHIIIIGLSLILSWIMIAVLWALQMLYRD